MREQIAKTTLTAASSPSAGSGSGETPSVAASLEKTKAAEEALRPLPLGWDLDRNSGEFTDWKGVVLELVGLLLTTVALTLGAPFWFDLLSKFIHLRGTGDKPARTEDS